MLHDGPKKFGRFIKKGSTVMNKVALEEFLFAEINPSPAIEQDNSRRSIVHAKYHPEEELKKSIVRPKKFEDELSHPDTRRPIIFPTDFTVDWEREKKLRKDRNQRQDEDDDFHYNEPYDAKTESSYDLTKTGSEHPSDSKGKPKDSTGRTSDPDDESEITRLHTPLKIAGPAIKEFSQNQIDDKLGSHFSIGAAPNATQAPLNLEEALNPKPDPKIENDPEGDFIANAPESVDSADSIVDPEQVASEKYKQRVAQEKVDQEKIQALYEEAKARGFEDGFRAGEEKGELQVRQSASTLFQKVHSLVESFMDIKSTVLDNVQENFYTISQAVAESLLKREFRVNPEAFAAVVRKAISDAVAPNEFKIKVHPKMAERLASISDKKFLQHVVKDPSVDEGDFKIESNLSVVDVNIGKLVSELIDQTDLSLFDESEKVG